MEYVRKLNPGVIVKWIIVENTPEGVENRFEIGGTDTIKVIKGVPNTFQGIAPASYHHASGLKLALAEAKTQFALILDPDFYIVRKGWIADVLSYMTEYKLAFFGAPYNPKRYMKYRYFPCIHAMFVDLERVSQNEIDFTPDYNQPLLLENREKVQVVKSNFIKKTVLFLKNHARIILKRNSVIGSSRDTGYRIYEKFHADQTHTSRALTPVFKFTRSGIKPWYLTSLINRLYETGFSDHSSYIPKKAGYFSERGFEESGFPSVSELGWDEFMWQGKPFGFHLQGARKDGKTTDHSTSLETLRRVLNESEKKGSGGSKTIFISLFEGVESKNILRTGIVGKVLELYPEARLVLFMKNKERADYYKKEFSDRRLIYEVVEPYEQKGIARVFSSLKFNFLQTKTTDLRALIIAEERGRAYALFSMVLHRLVANSFFIRIFRALDQWLVKSKEFESYFEKYKPDLVFLANLFEDFEIDFLKTAKKHAVKSIGLINSWDRVTARCIIRLLPDKLIVFNSTLHQELLETNDVRNTEVYISGLPQYDKHFSAPTLSKEDLFKKLGITTNKKLVVYSPIGGRFSNSDWEIMDRLYELNNEKKFGDDVVLLVRFPPNDFIKDEDLKKRPHLLYQYPGTRFSTWRSTDWDMNAEELEDLHNTLVHMSLIICYASSISIDAVVCDKPVININYEIKDNKLLSKSPTIFYSMTHYKKALDQGGIALVDSEHELIEATRQYLENPFRDAQGRKKLTIQQCTYTDGRSVERIADYIVDSL